MKILITGTHFTPAQAVIDEFKKDPAIELVYVGRNNTREGDKTPSPESQIVPRLGVKFIPISSGRLQRSFTRYTIPSLLRIPWGFIQALMILKQEKPDVLLSFGGYVAVPLVLSAKLFSIPIIIHEQTLVPGLANQISSFFADKIAVSFANHPFSSSRPNTVLTGNPLRKELLKPDKARVSKEVAILVEIAKKMKLPLILVIGGNQGSHVINMAFFGALEQILDNAVVIHQTGDSKYQDYEKLSQKQKSNKHHQRYLVKKWIDVSDLTYIFSNLDLAVSRAGINTLLELAYFGIPAVLIPIPYLSGDEQNINARFFADAGLAKILPQDNLSSDSLYQTVNTLLKELPKWKKSARRSEDLVITDAPQRLVLETLTLAKRK